MEKISFFPRFSFPFLFRILLSLICIIWIGTLLRDMNWSESKSLIHRTSLPLVLGALATIAGLYWTRLIRLRCWIGNLSSSSLPFREWTGLYLKSIALGSITPARLGDFSRVHLLSATGISAPVRIRIVLLEKVSDLFYLPVAALLTWNVLDSKFGFPPELTVSISLLILIGQGFAIRRLVGSLGVKALITGLWLTLPGFACFISSNILLFYSVGIDLDVLSIIAVTTAAGFMASLPVSLGGLGVREGTLLVSLGLWGISIERVLPLIYLEFIVNIIFPVILYGIYVLVRNTGVKRLSEEKMDI